MAGKQQASVKQATIDNNSQDSHEASLRAMRNRLNKHRLQLIFSYLGRDSELDETIKQFKQKIQQTRNEDDRDKLFDTIISEILSFSDSSDMQARDAENKERDLFTEFLSKLSMTHDNADAFVEMRKRLGEIKEQQDQLAVINDTIKLLSQDTDSGVEKKKELVLELIDYISLPKDTDKELEKLKQQVYISKSASELGKQLRNIAGIVNEANQKAQNEFREIRQYISQVTGQLGEINETLTDNLKQNSRSLDESREMNKTIFRHHEELQLKIDSSSDIDEIRECVNQHINAVNENLKAHLEIENKRQDKTEKNLKSVKSRLNGMKKKCSSLEIKLEKAKQEAMHDTLTGLPNRLALDERFTNELARFQRYGHVMSCAVLDIDHFKSVNDTWGHKAGDRVLKAVASVCKQNIREADFIARFGGEEFVLLMPDTPLKKARQAMDDLRACIEAAHFHYNEETVPITISIGVSMLANDDNSTTVFKRADDALYAAKNSGRNKVMTEQELKAAA